MNVLSLFDGISAGQLALKKAGIHVDNYFASEIDPYAIKITQRNFPNTIQLGSVENWREWNLPKIDLVIGGSPCQGFSNAGLHLNFEDPRSKLFFTFVDVVLGLSPRWWMLENVKMKQEWLDIISFHLSTNPVFINSALVSAQNRQRYYWANFPITIPEDKHIRLADILEQVGKPLSQAEVNYMNRTVADGRNHWDFAHHSDTANDKSSAVVANFYKGVPYNVIIDRRLGTYDKTETARESECIRVGMANDINGHDILKRVYSPEGKAPTINTMNGGNREPKVAVADGLYRKLSPVECERLQTFPDDYTAGISNTRRYHALGNSWTVDVVAHIFGGMK